MAIQPGRRRRASLRRPRPRRRHRLRALLIALTVLAAISGGLVGGTFVGYASYRAQLPDAATVAAMEPGQDSHVYDTKGNLIAVLSSKGVRHVHATLDNIAQYARLATIDIEDRHFYGEGSWDLPRLVKAGWDNVRHTSTSGASTITEQLAKISFFNSPERSVDYKIKEIVLGNEIDANFTKNQILEMYLNRVPYGNHAVGIETAAQLYFFKAAKDLDLAESAILAGLPQSPTAYNPLLYDAPATVNPLAKDRQKVVLSAMVSNGDISQRQADTAYAEPLTFHSWTESELNTHPTVTVYVTNWLKYYYGSAYINPGGWDIYTTVNPGMQKAAEASLHDGIAAIRDAHNAKDGALVNIDPKTGKVLAIVGAWDYNDPEVGQTAMALNARSPGSAIKLFTYTAALASHMYTMETPILDAPVHLSPGPGQDDYSPLNYDRKWHGTCALKACFGNSLNVPAVKVEAAVGIPYITSVEIAAGIDSYSVAGAGRPGATSYSATLGGFPVTPLELADAAATIADLGVHHDPSPVDHIVLRGSGKTMFTLDPTASARRVVPENVAFIVNEITSNDANRVPDFPAHGPLTLPDRRVSAKTGTAEYFNDNWTLGWTPDIVTAVWVGNPKGSCLKDSDRATMSNAIQRGHVLFTGMTIKYPFSPSDLAQYGLQPRNNACGHLDNSDGITGAAPIWHNDMVVATAGFNKTDWYAVPKDVVQVGTGDNADFFLPGTTAQQPGAGGNCYYWGPPGTPPPPTPANGTPCVYTGAGPPSNQGQPGQGQGQGHGQGQGQGQGGGHGGGATSFPGPPQPAQPGPTNG
ncbi:MAG: transglycosylase domain-containing protein [Candidatus Dormibacteraeota bacterium]|uniref:Transglycosylase domain-containing protein n=1 Tax=Candidatus Amunia macphersoniae TaxID=3127014 RepID=A0A934KNX5_9BACT|nr:transglycosylase domain-containing protein [Candidatus Dormibacteraeota bacterium]